MPTPPEKKIVGSVIIIIKYFHLFFKTGTNLGHIGGKHGLEFQARTERKMHGTLHTGMFGEPFLCIFELVRLCPSTISSAKAWK